MNMKRFIPQKIKNIYHLLQALVASFFYGFPARKIKIIGVTGTNGKTTTVQMIAKILEEAGKKVALASTINFQIGEKKWINRTKFTTLSAFQVQQFIQRAVKKRCQYLILEVSSHSLDQNRVWGLHYNIAVITNVTREHLDYHKTMRKYRQVKLKLFNRASAIVVNLDMENPEDFLNNQAREKYGFSIKSSNLRKKIKQRQIKVIQAHNVRLETGGTFYQIQKINYQLKLPGQFNLENALAATGVGLACGIKEEIISIALAKIQGIAGRMEYVPNEQGLKIVVDYAVTPDSLEKLYTLITNLKKKNYKQGKVIAVFGACGERDRGKRPIMGQIVDQQADYIILTNEDPYNENPQKILKEITKGIREKKAEKTFWQILDRREAIKKALQLAKPNDWIIITGKGAEETMAIKKERIIWNDKKVIQEELQKLKLK